MPKIRVLTFLLCLLVTIASPHPAEAKAPRANLKVVSITLSPSAVKAGEQTAAAAKVKNVGKATAARSRTSFLLSADDTKSRSDLSLGVAGTGKLTSSEKGTVSLALRVPASTKAGTWYVLACADAGTKIKESSEKDNCAATRLTVKAVAPPPPDVVDSDSDGVADDADNCTSVANQDQADADADGKGDVCDFCPVAANPGDAGCPVVVYDVKDGTVPVGTKVRIREMVVTGVAAVTGGGVWAQLPAGDPAYEGPLGSAIEIDMANPPALSAGDVIEVEGTVDASLHLDATSIVVTGSANLPSPQSTTVQMMNINAAGYDSLLVKIGAADGSESSGSWDVRDVGALAHFYVRPTIIGTLPTVASYALDITGVVVNESGGFHAVLPRSAADIVARP